MPYGEPQAFIDAAVQLARAPQSLDMIRQQARAYVASVDWQCVVERFVALPDRGSGRESHRPHLGANTLRSDHIVH